MPSYPLRTTPTTTASIPALHRKSPPTCTLSLAHVSASPFFHSQKKSSFKIKNSELNLSTMQLDLRVDFSSVISVPVQVHVVDPNTTFSSTPQAPHSSSATPPTGVRRSKSKKRTHAHAKRNVINYIPFPSTSPPPATESSVNESFIYSSRPNYSSNSSSSSGTPHVLLRASTINHTPQQPQQAGPKRGRKNTVHVGSPASVPPVPPLPKCYRKNTPESIAPSVATQSPAIVSPLPVRIQALRGPALASGVVVQRSPIELIPERPCSPGPHSIGQQQVSVTSLKQQLKSEDTFDPPPYTSPPPPYSASPAGIVASPDDKIPSAPIHAPRPLPSILTQHSRIPTPAVKPLQTPTVPSQLRRQRISPSDLKILVFLYRTIMYGVEKRYRAETAARASGYVTPPNSYSTPAPIGVHVTHAAGLYHHGSATHVAEIGAPAGVVNAGSPSRFGRFPVIEEEEENENDQVISSFSSSERRQRKAELEVQDALLAIRLRAFLKTQGVAESELDVQFEGERSAEEEEEDERMMEEVEQEIRKINKSSDAPLSEAPAPARQVPDRPIRSSPPPLSPVPKPARRRSVLSTSYMIAFLLMKHRMTSAPRKGFGSVGSGKDKRAHSGGASSGLRVCSWTASECDGETVVEELEEEFDSCSVVDWYAGMDY